MNIIKITMMISLIWAAGVFAEAQLKTVSVEGTVEFAKEGSEKWQDLKTGKMLATSHQVKTQRESRVRLQMLNGSEFRIGENSQVLLGSLEKQQGKNKVTRLAILKGSMLFKVKPLKNSLEQMEFETRTATAAIRGTECQMEVATEQMGIGCFEGLVELSDHNGKFKVNVSPGMLAFQKSDGSVRTYSFNDEANLRDALQTLNKAMQSAEMPDIDSLLSEIVHRDSAMVWLELKMPDGSVQKEKVSTGIWKPFWVPETWQKQNFSGWKVLQGKKFSIRDSLKSASEINITSGNVTLEALYTRPKVTLKLKSKGQGNVNQEKTVVYSGDSVKVSAVEKGDLFVRWQVVEGDAEITGVSQPLTSIRVFSDATAEAVFSNKVKELILNGSQGGTTNIQGKYKEVPGEPIVLIATSEDHFYFEKWVVEKGDALIENPENPRTRVVLVDSASVVKALFKSKMQVRISFGQNNPAEDIQEYWLKPGEELLLNAPVSRLNGAVRESFSHWEITGGQGVIADPNSYRTTVKAESALLTLRPVYQRPPKKLRMDFYNSEGQKKSLILDYAE